MTENQEKKKYGLMFSQKKHRGKFSAITKPVGIFARDSSEEDEAKVKAEINESIQEESKKKITVKQTQIEIEKALKEDPTVYQYDEVYEDLQSNKIHVGSSKEETNKKPKYIDGLLKAAAIRKREDERRQERKIQKEREKEGDEFEDKEAFVTSSYRKKMVELQEEEEKQRKQDEVDAANEVTKQKDLTQFYRHLLTKNVSMGGSYDTSVDTTKKDKQVERNTNDRGSDSDPEKFENSKHDKINRNKKSGDKRIESLKHHAGKKTEPLGNHRDSKRRQSPPSSTSEDSSSDSEPRRGRNDDVGKGKLKNRSKHHQSMTDSDSDSESSIDEVRHQSSGKVGVHHKETVESVDKRTHHKGSSGKMRERGTPDIAHTNLPENRKRPKKKPPVSSSSDTSSSDEDEKRTKRKIRENSTKLRRRKEKSTKSGHLSRKRPENEPPVKQGHDKLKVRKLNRGTFDHSDTSTSDFTSSDEDSDTIRAEKGKKHNSKLKGKPHRSDPRDVTLDGSRKSSRHTYDEYEKRKKSMLKDRKLSRSPAGRRTKDVEHRDEKSRRHSREKPSKVQSESDNSSDKDRRDRVRYGKKKRYEEELPRERARKRYDSFSSGDERERKRRRDKKVEGKRHVSGRDGESGAGAVKPVRKQREDKQKTQRRADEGVEDRVAAKDEKENQLERRMKVFAKRNDKNSIAAARKRYLIREQARQGRIIVDQESDDE